MEAHQPEAVVHRLGIKIDQVEAEEVEKTTNKLMNRLNSLMRTLMLCIQGNLRNTRQELWWSLTDFDRETSSLNLPTH